MNEQFQGFDEKGNNAGLMGALTGAVAGTVSVLFGIREWWAWGWGPEDWNRSTILHAYWLAFVGHLVPTYRSDFGAWEDFRNWLLLHHEYDAFVASFWVPMLVGTMVGLLAAVSVVRAMNRKSGGKYIRGSRSR
jgi:hypothetical protein